MTSVNHLHLHHFSQLKINLHDFTLTWMWMRGFILMQCVNKFATYAVGISKAIYMHNTHLDMQICT